MEFHLFVMSLGALLIIGSLLCQLFLMKLQRKLFLPVGEEEQSGRAGVEAGGQGPCPPWFERRGGPVEGAAPP